MSAPGGQGHREEDARTRDCMGHVWTEESDLDRLDELEAEVERLREALEEITKWAEAARGHYGIEECSGPGRPRTEWDEIQDGLRAAALFAREALSGPAPDEDRG